MKIAKLSLVILAFLASAAAASGDGKKTPWKMSGDLEEACSCDAACPCWFDSKPTKMTCGGGQVIFIEKGSYGDVPLDGLGIAMMGQSPEGKTMMESIGNWNFLNFYIDEKANSAQRKALEEIVRATSPPAVAPEKIQIRYVPITRKIQGGEHVVTVGKYAGFSGHLIPGGMGGASPKLANSPGADPIHKEYSQGRTSKQTLDDAGQKWSWANSNYMYTTFHVTSEDYDKFTTMMMQEMEKAKAAAGSRTKS
ncbi:MAG TPA: DUF1326 domain-containing protein [Thermoanaerobaculia bacterium]|nr:DUF1326 domain-containing protein [Thermoanaerobaculia bacterium]